MKNEEKMKKKMNLNNYLLEGGFLEMRAVAKADKAEEFNVLIKLGRRASYITAEVTFQGDNIRLQFGMSYDANPYTISTGNDKEAWEQFSSITLADILSGYSKDDRESLFETFFSYEGKGEEDPIMDSLYTQLCEVAGQCGYDAAEYAELDSKDTPLFESEYEEWYVDHIHPMDWDMDEEEKEEFLTDHKFTLSDFQEAAESTFWITLDERRVDEEYEEEEEEEKED